MTQVVSQHWRGRGRNQSPHQSQLHGRTLPQKQKLQTIPTTKPKQPPNQTKPNAPNQPRLGYGSALWALPTMPSSIKDLASILSKHIEINKKPPLPTVLGFKHYAGPCYLAGFTEAVPWPDQGPFKRQGPPIPALFLQAGLCPPPSLSPSLPSSLNKFST